MSIYTDNISANTNTQKNKLSLSWDGGIARTIYFAEGGNIEDPAKSEAYPDGGRTVSNIFDGKLCSGTAVFSKALLTYLLDYYNKQNTIGGIKGMLATHTQYVSNDGGLSLTRVFHNFTIVDIPSIDIQNFGAKALFSIGFSLNDEDTGAMAVS